MHVEQVEIKRHPSVPRLAVKNGSGQDLKNACRTCRFWALGLEDKSAEIHSIS